MDQFLGEIRQFAGSFAPKGWAFCNGQLLSIQQNTALYAVIGTTYGGDGKTTFALPDLRGKVTIHQGQGPGLTPRAIGSTGGSASVTLTESEMSNHSHVPNSQGESTQILPDGSIWANVKAGRGSKYIYTASPNTAMSPQALQTSGGSQPHNNMQPYLGLNFIIALEGIFPSRS